MSRYSDSLRVINKYVDKRALRQVINKFRTLSTTAAICSTEAATQIKSVSLDGFCLTTGACLRVLFVNENTAETPKLQINEEPAKEIKVNQFGSKINIPKHEGKWRGASSYTYEIWQPNTILELMYDGTDFVIVGNPIVEEYSNANQRYMIYASGLIVLAYGGSSGTINFLVKFSNTPAIVTGLTSSSNQAIPYFAFGHSEGVGSIQFGQSGQAKNYFVAYGY